MRASSAVLSLLLLVVLPRLGHAEDPPTWVRQWGSYGSGPGQFNSPFGIAVEPSGTILVVDSFNNRIERFSNVGSFLGQVGGLGSGSGTFNNPIDVAVDGTDTIYISDGLNSLIQVLDSSLGFVRQWPGPAHGWLALDPTGQNLYIAVVDTVFTYRTTDGQIVNRWAYTPQFFPSGSYAFGFAVGPSGSIYIASPGTHTVRKFSADGLLLSEWGSEGDGNGQFQRPEAMAVDGSENVYVTDGSARVQKFTSQGGFLSAWGSPGTGGGQFSSRLTDIATDANRTIYVLDNLQDRIVQFMYAATPIIPSSWGGLKLRFR